MGELSSPRPSKIMSRVLTICMGYGAFISLTGVILIGVINGVLPVLIEGSIFTVFYVALAYSCWRENRWGYLGAGIVPLVVLAAQWNTPAGIMSVLQSPGGSTPFALFLPFFVTSATAVFYGLYGAYASRRLQPYSKQISRSGIVAFVALGAIVGGLLVGAFAASAESRL